MKVFSIAAFIVLTSLAGLTYAQRAPQRQETFITQPTPISVEQLLEEHKTNCFLPDDTSRPLNTATTFDGQRYQCVEVFTSGVVRPGQPGRLAVHMAGWVRVP